jgi:SDR family mycofactocin-dependent oxidoreductase
VAGRLEGKVALITGAARGQGRSHAVRLASEGCDIVAVDLCEDITSVSYPMSSREDLAETARLVEALDQRVVQVVADVREYDAMRAAAAQAISELGKLDIVVANAGISAEAPGQDLQTWADVLSVDLVGALNTVNASLPHMKEGASVIVIGSAAALMAGGVGTEPGSVAYMVAKRAMIDIVKQLAIVLAPRMMRINGIHPTNCNTLLLQHQTMWNVFRPDLENPTQADAELAFPVIQSMPTPYIEPEDVSNAVAFLASDEAKWITGQYLGVDAGAILKL